MGPAMQPRKFWMVKGAGPTTCIHFEREDADREADRLSRLHPGVNFYILEAVACHRKVDVERIDLSERIDAENDEIPF